MLTDVLQPGSKHFAPISKHPQLSWQAAISLVHNLCECVFWAAKPRSYDGHVINYVKLITDYLHSITTSRSPTPPSLRPGDTFTTAHYQRAPLGYTSCHNKPLGYSSSHTEKIGPHFLLKKLFFPFYTVHTANGVLAN